MWLQESFLIWVYALSTVGFIFLGAENERLSALVAFALLLYMIHALTAPYETKPVAFCILRARVLIVGLLGPVAYAATSAVLHGIITILVGLCAALMPLGGADGSQGGNAGAWLMNLTSDIISEAAARNDISHFGAVVGRIDAVLGALHVISIIAEVILQAVTVWVLVLGHDKMTGHVMPVNSSSRIQKDGHTAQNIMTYAVVSRVALLLGRRTLMQSIASARGLVVTLLQGFSLAEPSFLLALRFLTCDLISFVATVDAQFAASLIIATSRLGVRSQTKATVVQILGELLLSEVMRKWKDQSINISIPAVIVLYGCTVAHIASAALAHRRWYTVLLEEEANLLRNRGG